MAKNAPRYEFIETSTRQNMVECHLAGVTYGKRQNSLAWLANLERDDKAESVSLVLRREKNNKYDKNAIRVAAHGVELNSYGFTQYNSKYGDLGYLPAALAAQIAPAMDSGAWVEIIDWHTVGRASKNTTVGMVLTLTWE